MLIVCPFNLATLRFDRSRLRSLDFSSLCISARQDAHTAEENYPHQYSGCPDLQFESNCALRIKDQSEIAYRINSKVVWHKPKDLARHLEGAHVVSPNTPLEHSRPDAAERLARRSGRPKGSKDKQQRARRQVKEDSSASSKAKAPPPTDVSATGTECPGKFDQAVASETLCPAKYVAIIQSSSPANGAKEEIPHWLEATSLGSTDPFHDDWPHWK